MVPPASPIALATLPSIPGGDRSPPAGSGCTERSASLAIGAVPSYCAGPAPGSAAHRFPGALRAPVSFSPCRAEIASTSDGGRALPDRRQQPRLPGVLRAARVDRDLHRGAHQRDLRVRVDARQDPHRLRPEGDGRRLGRRLQRPQGGLPRVQGPARQPTRPAERAVAPPGTARGRLRLPQPRRRGLRGRRRDRLDRRERQDARTRRSR